MTPCPVKSLWAILFSLESAQPYMDIYQSAMDPAVREIEEQTLRAQNDARARASTGGGAFGSRLGIMEGTVAGEGAQAAGDLRAGAAREGLNFASGRFDTDRQARFGADTQARQAYETNEASRIQSDGCIPRHGPNGARLADASRRWTYRRWRSYAGSLINRLWI